MVINQPLGQADEGLIEALSDHIDDVAEGIRSRAARESEVAKRRFAKLAEEYAESDPLAQTMIADALADFDRVPEFFAAVARHAMERKLEPLRQPRPEDPVVIEGSYSVVEEENDDTSADKDAGRIS